MYAVMGMPPEAYRETYDAALKAEQRAQGAGVGVLRAAAEPLAATA